MWEVDERTLPPFGCELKVTAKKGNESIDIKRFAETKPHGRSVILTLENPLPEEALSVELRCTDFLGNLAEKLVLEVQHQ